MKPAGITARRSTGGRTVGDAGTGDGWRWSRLGHDGGHRGLHGASGSWSRPAVSGQPVDEVERLDRLAGGALDEVVLDADDDDPTGPLVEADANRRTWLLPVTCFVAGGVETTDTNGSSS